MLLYPVFQRNYNPRIRFKFPNQEKNCFHPRLTGTISHPRRFPFKSRPITGAPFPKSVALYPPHTPHSLRRNVPVRLPGVISPLSPVHFAQVRLAPERSTGFSAIARLSTSMPQILMPRLSDINLMEFADSAVISPEVLWAGGKTLIGILVSMDIVNDRISTFQAAFRHWRSRVCFRIRGIIPSKSSNTSSYTISMCVPFPLYLNYLNGDFYRVWPFVSASYSSCF